MFKKFFGKKNDGFYLQLEDDDNAPKPAAKAKSQPPASTAKAPTIAEPAALVTPVMTTQVAPAAVTQAASAAKLEAKAEKEAARAAKKAVKQAETDKKSEEVKASVAAPAPAQPAITNFATDYLIKPSSASSRRRPGANMNGFLDMARQAKKPEPFKK